MLNLRAVCAGSLLLASGLFADAPVQLGRMQQTLDFPGQETVVGKVWFQVEREREDRVYFKPLTTPTLGMGRLKGQDNPGLGLIQCLIVKRAAIINPDVVLNVTLARCPNNREYVVDEVLFDVANTVPATPVKQ